MKKRVVIIGGGFSGSLTALQLFRQKERPEFEVVLVERTGNFGTGYAYGVTSENFLLNVRAVVMGAWPEAPGDFAEWLNRSGYGVDGNGYVPRAWFGTYIKDLLSKPATDHAGDSLTFQTASAERIKYDKASHTWEVTLADGQTQTADAVVLALGNLERESLNGIAVGAALSKPYAASTYENLERAKELLVLGSSLSAIDVIVEAEKSNFRGRYTILSRHGRLPQVHTVDFEEIESSPGWTEHHTALGLLRLCKQHARRANDSQPALASLRPVTQQCWQRLSLKERRRFLRHLQPIWTSHRSRIPGSHAELLSRIQQAGRLRIMKGTIDQVTPLETGANVRCRLRNSRTKFVEEHFDRVVLATGPESDVRRIQMPLIKDLIAQNLIVPGELNLGTHRANDAPDSLYLIGPLQREELWEITAVRELRAEAARVAGLIVHRASTHEPAQL